MSHDKQKKPEVSLQGAAASPKPVRKNFPGPRGAFAPLRVAFEGKPYAELIAHAKSSLKAEVCGVLAGQIGQDDEGLFVHVQAIVCGAAAGEGSTHVTFTQETWNHIHETMDRDYPKLRMVGWYHTHPGFGVEFSEMDLFIQRNFFSGEAQIALVTDPLSGASAVITTLPGEGITYLPHYWVDGRQQTSIMPATAAPATSSASAATTSGGRAASYNAALETRVEQLSQAMDALRNDIYKVLMFLGFIICVGVSVGVGFFIRSLFVSRNEPPHLNSFMPIPVQVGDKKVMLGLDIVSWDVPPELNAMLQDEMKKRVEEMEKKLKEAGIKMPAPDANAPQPGAPAPPPAAAPPSPTAPAPVPADPTSPATPASPPKGS